jgi:hypothetical protein
VLSNTRLAALVQPPAEPRRRASKVAMMRVAASCTRRVAAVMAVLAISHSTGPSAQQAPEAVPGPRFEVVSIRPVTDNRAVKTNNGVNILPGGRLEANEALLMHVVRFAHDLQSWQRVIGGEALLDERFTIKAVASGDLPVPRRAGVYGTLWEKSAFTDMTRAMLAERFALKTHWPLDATGLEGAFDISTRINVLTLPGNAGVDNLTRQPYEDYPSFTDALRRDLGLRIESERRPVRMLVIDNLQPPTEN